MENGIVDAVASPVLVAAEAAAGTPWYEVLATFLSSITGSLAWPIVLLVLVFTFKEHIIKALRNIKSFKWGDAEAIFDTVKAATEEAKALDPVEAGVAEANRDVFDELLETARHSPTGAIIDAWKKIEQLTQNVIEHEWAVNPTAVSGINAGRSGDRPLPMHTAIRALSNSHLLGRAEINTFDYLREVRNRAAHVTDADITVQVAEQYVRLADKLMDALQQIRNDQMGIATGPALNPGEL